MKLLAGLLIAIRAENEECGPANHKVSHFFKNSQKIAENGRFSPKIADKRPIFKITLLSSLILKCWKITFFFGCIQVSVAYKFRLHTSFGCI